MTGLWEQVRQAGRGQIIAVLAFVGILVVLGLTGQVDSVLDLLLVLLLGVILWLGVDLRQRLDHTLTHSAQAGTDQIELLAEFPPDLHRRLESAREIWLVGISLARTVYTYYSLLEYHVADGRRLRILLVNPEGPACELAAQRTLARRTPEHQQMLIHQTLGQLRELGAASGASGELQIRLTDYLPPFTGIIVDPDTARGRIYIDYLTYRLPGHDGPRLVLRPEHKHWWEHFHSQFETLWVYATPWVRGVQEAAPQPVPADDTPDLEPFDDFDDFDDALESDSYTDDLP